MLFNLLEPGEELNQALVFYIHSFIYSLIHSLQSTISLQGFHLNQVYFYSFYTFTFKTFKTNNGSFGLIPALED